MIKLPSIQSLTTQVSNVFKRFPLTVLSSVILATSFISLTKWTWNFEAETTFMWGKLAMCSGLGLSLFLATALLSEAKGHTPNKKTIIQFITLGIIIAYYFTIEKYEHFNIEVFTRYTLYIIAAHLFVAFAAFTGTNKINGFWQFNKTIFLRILLSGLYTCVLYGGLSLALWLIDDLLHIEIKYTKYLYLWYILSTIVNTLIFLAGIPKDMSELENNTSYPKGLKAFTQFVLLPLVTFYLLILYIYFGKIIIHWNLPKGYVSYLVISFSIMGILSLLLIYPVRDNEENKWIKIFSRWFYAALYPLIILLGVSIYHRISDYGITEHRYFIMILAVWLVFIASYFLLSKKDNIKIIPVTLFFLAVFTSAGPWGAFSISHHSQKNRLEKILTTKGILLNGKVIKSNNLDDTARRSIESIVRYMEDANALTMIQPWFKQNIDSMHSSHTHYSNVTDSLLEIMGMPPTYPNWYNNSKSFQFEAIGNRETFTIKGFDYYTNFTYRHYQRDSAKVDTANDPQYLTIGADSILFIPYHLPCKYALVKQGKTLAIIELYSFINTIHKQFDSTGSNYTINVPVDKFVYEQQGLDGRAYQFRFSNIGVRKTDNTYYIEDISVVILTKQQ